MTSWPSTLPQKPLSSGYQEVPPDNTVRTEMDAGPAKVRRRFTANVRKMIMKFELDLSQVDTLDSFFDNTIKSGALSFDMPHPRTGNTVTARIVKPPEYKSIGGEYFDANIEMEILP